MSGHTTIAMVRKVPPRCLTWKAGPWVGMAALQLAIRKRQPEWLAFMSRDRSGGYRIGPRCIPWFWCWMDAPDMLRHASANRPFLAGPNLYPSQVLGDHNCLRVFVHSRHHLAWLERGSKASLKEKAVLLPYPITPIPAGPLPAEADVLLYAKKVRAGEAADGLIGTLREHWPRLVILRYGNHTRQQLIDAARRSRCCVYWSRWDTGSLVQAETMLAGCPNVGTRHGSPWLVHGENGVMIDEMHGDALPAAIGQALSINRENVREWAMTRFEAGRVADRWTAELFAAVDDQGAVS